MPAVTVLAHRGPPVLPAVYRPNRRTVYTTPPASGAGFQIIDLGTQSSVTIANGTVDGQSAIVSDVTGQVSPISPKTAYGTFNIGPSLPFNLRYQSYILVWSAVNGVWVVS